MARRKTSHTLPAWTRSRCPAKCARVLSARKLTADAQVIVIEKGRKSARAANDYAHDRPWTTAGVALGVGVLIGLLIGRK